MDFWKTAGKVHQGLKIAQGVKKANGLPSAEIAMSGFFDRRLSTVPSFLEGLYGHIQKSRDDLPRLAKRKTFHFPSGENTLQGYYYPAKNPKALVLCCHGLNGMADDNFSLCIDALLRRNYAVVALDLSASGRSSGLRISGLHQGALDVNALERYIANSRELSEMPLLLLGHSWGAYSVSASTYFDQTPLAVCALSGFSCPIDVMLSIPAKAVGGGIVQITEPAMREALEKRAGPYYNLAADEAIERAVNTDFFIIHGSLDTTIVIELASLWRKFQHQSIERIWTYMDTGKRHMDIWLTRQAASLFEEVVARGKPLVKEYGKNLNKWPKNVLQGYLGSFDKEKINTVDEELFDQIDSFYEKALKRHEAK